MLASRLLYKSGKCTLEALKLASKSEKNMFWWLLHNMDHVQNIRLCTSSFTNLIKSTILLWTWLCQTRILIHDVCGGDFSWLKVVKVMENRLHLGKSEAVDHIKNGFYRASQIHALHSNCYQDMNNNVLIWKVMHTTVGVARQWP